MRRLWSLVVVVVVVLLLLLLLLVLVLQMSRRPQSLRWLQWQVQHPVL